MKCSTSTLVLATALLVGAALPSEAVSDWPQLQSDLVDCFEPAAKCLRNNGRWLYGGNKARCDKVGGKWSSAFANGDELKKAVEATLAGITGNDKTVFLLQPSNQERVSTYSVKRWSQTVGAPMGDYMNCGSKAKPLMFTFATKAQAEQAASLRAPNGQNVFTAVMALPKELKFSPQLLQGMPKTRSSAPVELLVTMVQGTGSDVVSASVLVW